ncbi:MAG: hypothetical protein ACR2HS_04265 [Gammaproteobacteria bacterium]
MCCLFNVSRSGYYSWLNREPSKQEIANQVLDKKITSIFEANKSRYGAPRVYKVLEEHMVIFTVLIELLGECKG